MRLFVAVVSLFAAIVLASPVGVLLYTELILLIQSRYPIRSLRYESNFDMTAWHSQKNCCYAVCQRCGIEARTRS